MIDVPEEDTFFSKIQRWQHEILIAVYCFENDDISMRGMIATQVLYLQSRMICIGFSDFS